ncbi:hypothetical protein HYW42_04585 [Candidatus Daviesbacteria bacterium]|nr:hypothetical protein [Candidatus Daviesbacteria bacterium]
MITEIPRIIRYEARKRLSEATNVRTALNIINTSPADFAQRTAELEAAILQTGSLFGRNRLNPRLYRDISALKLQLGADHPHTLDEWVGMYQEGLKGEAFAATPRFFDGTYARLNRLIVAKENPFTFATQIQNPNQLASGLLLEGYGFFLGQFHGNPEIARTTVLALEACLLLHFPKASLLSDVICWMKEEKADFPSGIAKRLARM